MEEVKVNEIQGLKEGFDALQDKILGKDEYADS